MAIQARELFPAEANLRRWRVAGGLLVALLMSLQVGAAFNTAGIPDFWRDVYWALQIAHAEQFPLGGPPIYNTFQLGPWWFYVLALPLALTGNVISVSVTTQLLSATKYLLAWRFGNRVADPRLGFALVAALAIAGWSIVPLYFITHTALVEAALVVLAICVWRCWLRFGWLEATLYGLTAALCAHAHPSTAPYVVVTSIALIVKHRRDSGVLKVGLAALIAISSLAPPFLQGSEVADQTASAFANYASSGTGLSIWPRYPKLFLNLIVGGPWHSFLLLTNWKPSTVVVAFTMFVAIVIFAIAGAWRARDRAPWLTKGQLALLGMLLLQTGFLVVARPITPMWMASSAVPCVAGALALGWYGWYLRGGREATVGIATTIIFVGLSVAPFGYFYRDITSVRVPDATNPFFDVSQTATRFQVFTVPFTTAMQLQSAGTALCDGATIHGRLATAMQQSLATPAAAACGKMPDLRFGGAREGVHLAGFPQRSVGNVGIASERDDRGLELTRKLRVIAPSIGDKPTQMGRMQINPDGGPESPKPFELSFDADADDVVAVTNRLPMFAPLDVESVSIEGSVAREILFDGTTRFYRCTDCDRRLRHSWTMRILGVEKNCDVVVVRRADARSAAGFRD